MPYVTTIERMAQERGHQRGYQAGRQEGWQAGRQEGWQEGRQEGGILALQDIIKETLDTRFGQVPAGLGEKLLAITELAALKRLHHQALTAASLEAFVQNARMN